MDIKELKAERAKLESTLAVLIDDKLSEFKERTGLAITNVSVYMRRIETIGCETQYVLEAVRADLEL